MKSEDGKKRWRAFNAACENKVKEFNFGSLIRTDSTGEYGEINTIFGKQWLSSVSNTRELNLFIQ